MSKNALPFDMFDSVRTPAEAAAAAKLAQLYHKGQASAWDGQTELKSAVARHDGLYLEPELAGPLGRIYAGIMWGELGAWQVSLAIALELEQLEAKLALTGQGLDESRHFYVLKDYLDLLGQPPQALGPKGNAFFSGVLSASSLAKKILGMHLMIEPLALTIFQLTQEKRVEPVLCDLLALFFKDEARHVALGVLILPSILKNLSLPETVELAAWQLKMYLKQLAMLKERSADLRALGMDPREVLRLARDKQLAAAQLLADEMGTALPLMDLFRRLVDFKAELDIPTEPTPLLRRLRLGFDAAIRNEDD